MAPGLRVENVAQRPMFSVGVHWGLRFRLAFANLAREEDALNELKMFSDGLKNAWVVLACNVKVCDHTTVPRALGTQGIAVAIITK